MTQRDREMETEIERTGEHPKSLEGPGQRGTEKAT